MTSSRAMSQRIKRNGGASTSITKIPGGGEHTLPAEAYSITVRAVEELDRATLSTILDYVLERRRSVRAASVELALVTLVECGAVSYEHVGPRTFYHLEESK